MHWFKASRAIHKSVNIFKYEWDLHLIDFEFFSKHLVKANYKKGKKKKTHKIGVDLSGCWDRVSLRRGSSRSCMNNHRYHFPRTRRSGQNVSFHKWIQNETEADQLFTLKCETEISKRAATLRRKTFFLSSRFLNIPSWFISTVEKRHCGLSHLKDDVPIISFIHAANNDTRGNLKAICWTVTSTGQRSSPLTHPVSLLPTPSQAPRHWFSTELCSKTSPICNAWKLVPSANLGDPPRID